MSDCAHSLTAQHYARCVLPGGQQRQQDEVAELDTLSAEVRSLSIAAHDKPSAIEQRGRTRTQETRNTRAV